VPETPPNPTIADDLRAAMRGLALSVSIISTGDKRGRRAAMTATSAAPLSLNPPAMLVCINRESGIYEILRQDADFCINILGANQRALAQWCSGRAKSQERFEFGAWRCEDDLPMIADAQAIIVCKQKRRLTFDTHDIIIGNVKRVRIGAAIDPLLYVNGSYARVGVAL
jgi:flavin reductase (DIM6/NTAB) family NADH-FMN oxidoreductase RutF